jgi:metal-responsive CopG/Arc/MetJ family transcriptional regulator
MIAVCTFGNMTEDLDKTVRVQVPMAEELRNKFKSVTAAEGKTMSEVILNFVKGYVEDKTEEKQTKSRS